MLQVQNLHKSYGTATVLDGINFVVNDGEHVGLIGPNGAGKTTLLRIITKREEPDTGTIVLLPRELRVGYLAQAFEQAAGMTVGEALAQAQSQLVQAEEAVQYAAEALSAGENMDEAMRAYEEAMARYEALGGWERGHHVEAVLEGLGLSDISRETPVEILSGGQKTRLGLALLLLQEPGLLLLDEPTNHLDVEALEWLEEFVQSYKGSVVVVSHDREFLDRTVSRVLYLDPVVGTIKSYTGNYSDFEAEREREYEAHVETWKRQQEYVEHTRQDIQSQEEQRVVAGTLDLAAAAGAAGAGAQEGSRCEVAGAQAGEVYGVGREGGEAEVAVATQARLRAGSGGWALGVARGGRGVCIPGWRGRGCAGFAPDVAGRCDV